MRLVFHKAKSWQSLPSLSLLLPEIHDLAQKMYLGNNFSLTHALIWPSITVTFFISSMRYSGTDSRTYWPLRFDDERTQGNLKVELINLQSEKKKTPFYFHESYYIFWVITQVKIWQLKGLWKTNVLGTCIQLHLWATHSSNIAKQIWHYSMDGRQTAVLYSTTSTYTPNITELLKNHNQHNLQ